MLPAQQPLARSLKIIRNLRLIPDERHLKAELALLAVQQERPAVVSWLNAHIFTVAQKDPELANNLLSSSFLFRDGVGVSAMLRLMGGNAGINMNGTDLIPKIIKQYAGRPVAVLGTKEPYLSQAVSAIEKLGAKVVLRMDGFEELDEYARQLALHPADLVVLGMGVPKQERVASYLADNLPATSLIVNGGAILDFMAGRFPRAPQVWRKFRLEWFFRLIQEPKRLGKRYLVGGAAFVFYAMKIAAFSKMRSLPKPQTEQSVVSE